MQSEQYLQESFALFYFQTGCFFWAQISFKSRLILTSTCSIVEQSNLHHGGQKAEQRAYKKGKPCPWKISLCDILPAEPPSITQPTRDKYLMYDLWSIFNIQAITPLYITPEDSFVCDLFTEILDNHSPSDFHNYFENVS